MNQFPTIRPWIYYNNYLYFFEMEYPNIFPLSSFVTYLYFFLFKLFFFMKIIITFLCKHSSMLTSYIIDVERNYESLLNVIISLGPIPCFHFLTRTLYIWKVIMKKNTISDCGWSRNSSYKWYANSNLHLFFCWNVTKNILLVWWMSTGIIITLFILQSHLILKQLIHLDLTIYWFYYFGKIRFFIKTLNPQFTKLTIWTMFRTLIK